MLAFSAQMKINIKLQAKIKLSSYLLDFFHSVSTFDLRNNVYLANDNPIANS